MKSILARVAAFCLAVTLSQASTFNIGATNSGWYDNAGGSNGTGNNSAQAGSYFGFTYHNWFGFNLSSVSETITGATLEIFSDANNASGQTVTWWDVTTPYASLGVSSLATYNDLGGGTALAIGGHTAGVINYYSFNAAGLASLNAASSFWAVGGSNNGGIAFGYTNGVSSNDYIRLVLTTGESVPDSASTLALFSLTLGLLGVACRKRS